MKNAYNESEAEKEKIKKILTDSQDKVLKRVQELKEQCEVEKASRNQLELRLAEKDKQIESLKNQVRDFQIYRVELFVHFNKIHKFILVFNINSFNPT